MKSLNHVLRFGLLATLVAPSLVGCGENPQPSIPPGQNPSTPGTPTSPGLPGTTTNAPGSTASGEAPLPTGQPSTAPDSSGTPTNSGPAGDPAQEAIGGLIAELCAWSDRCCDSGEFSYVFGNWTKDVATCTKRMIAAYNSNDSNLKDRERLGEVDGEAARLLKTIAFEIDSARSRPVAAQVNRCTDYIKSLGCNKPLSDERCEPMADEGKLPCRIGDMFTGTLTKGQLCNKAFSGPGRDIECKEGFSCGKDENAAGGADHHICVAKGLEGAQCFPKPDDAKADSTCEYGLYCHPTEGVCKKSPGLGEPCAYKDYSQVQEGSEKVRCQAPYSCDPVAKVCVQTCSKGTRCQNDDRNCANGQSCLPYAYAGSATTTQTFCGDRLDLGGYCDSQADCKPGLHCNFADDSYGRGVLGRCAADRTQGETCDFDFQCGSDRYCANRQTDADPVTPETRGTCKLLLSADSLVNECLGDGHRACFKGARGCFKTGFGKYGCIKEVSEGIVHCEPKDIMGLEEFKYLREVPGWARINPNGKEWGTICPGGVCSQSESGEGMNVCVDGLKEGDRGCDYDANTPGKLSCSPGLVCVQNSCVKPIAPGGACELFPSTQPGDVNKSFRNNVCDPDSECKQITNYYACSVVTPNKRVNNCMGK